MDARPHWQDVELTRDYRVSFSVVAGQVLHSRPRGDAGPDGMERLFERRREVLQEAGLWDRPHCEIKDYSVIPLAHHRGARAQFARLMSEEYERGQLRGYWGYGGPLVFRWIMAAAKAITAHPEAPAEFVADYDTALSRALLQLNAPVPTHRGEPRRTCREDWSLAVSGYKVTLEVWDDAILYHRAEGRLSRTAATRHFDLAESVLSTPGLFPDGHHIFMADASNLRRVDWNTLRHIQRRFQKLQSRHPCRGVVTFGASRTVQAVSAMAQLLLPFPGHMVTTRQEAVRVARRLLEPAYTSRRWPRLHLGQRFSERELQQRVTELVQYAAAINWHAYGIEDPTIGPDEPLAPVYALLRVLKHDYDTMLADRDRLQAEMLQAAKLSSVGRLAAGAAHELNSPLTAVLGYADHIRRKSTDPQSKEHAERALRCALRMRDTIDQLSAYNRRAPDSGAEEPVDLNAVVEESLALLDPLMEQHRVDARHQLAPHLPTVRSTAAQLQSVVFNLLTNAFDSYAPDEDQDSNPVLITTREDDGWAELQCQDWGEGMSQSAQARALDPFYTTKDPGEGTGLGLYVTHRIVTAAGGTIRIDSEPGVGTTVTVRFPGA